MSASLRLVSATLICVLSVTSSATAQEPQPGEQTELDELFAAARNYEIRAGDKSRKADLREPALLNFSNPERNQERGTVLVWVADERPIAIGQFFRYNTPNGVRGTKHALHSLSSTRVTATVEGKVAWAPTTPGLAWHWAEDLVPAETSNARLLQMRQLARRFRLTLTNPKNEPTDLRLTPRPLFEYAAAESGVQSGAIFSFVIATDPEAILVIEAADHAKQRQYRYAFARFHFQQLTARLDDIEVWRVDYDPSMMRNRPGDPATMGKIYSSFVP